MGGSSGGLWGQHSALNSGQWLWKEHLGTAPHQQLLAKTHLCHQPSARSQHSTNLLKQQFGKFRSTEAETCGINLPSSTISMHSHWMKSGIALGLPALPKVWVILLCPSASTWVLRVLSGHGMSGRRGCGTAWSWHEPIFDHQSTERSTRHCKQIPAKLCTGVKKTPRVCWFFPRSSSRRESWKTPRSFRSPLAAVEQSFYIALLASAASMGEEERREASHTSASPEGLLIPEYKLQENQSFIFTLFSCLQIKVKAPVL